MIVLLQGVRASTWKADVTLGVTTAQHAQAEKGVRLFCRACS